MMISAVLVATLPEHVDETRAAVAAHEWADVHHVESEKGRIIATIEAATTHEATARILELRNLPHILLAEMVEHFVDDEAGK
ncbi:MAG: chaperone NapD [Deltaproteobacteria bacterium]|nr:chaperone NapD [Deltaproteobacteria bacterium]MBW2393456.1 chaperone NapD [Deltaproteobacteria bacterium]